MIPQKDRIESAIRHIQTSVDIDPWAMELAVDALKAQGTCEDAVSRQTLQKELALYPIDDITSEDEAGYNRAINDVQKMVLHLPSAQPEIIHCGECKHRDPEDHKCDCGHDIIWQLPRDDKWYCADAERKDGADDNT